MVKSSELGAYTNNLPNKEGIKKLLTTVNNVYTKSEVYSKTETDDALAEKFTIADSLPTGKETTDTVTFQDLIDLGIIVIPPEPEPETEN